MNEQQTPSLGVAFERDLGRDVQTLSELSQCFRAHAPDVRVVGNVRAEDAARAVDLLRAEVVLLKRSRQMDENEARSREQILRAEAEALRALLREAHDFWANYSSMPEQDQDDMRDEKNAMLERMRALPNAELIGAGRE